MESSHVETSSNAVGKWQGHQVHATQVLWFKFQQVPATKRCVRDGDNLVVIMVEFQASGFLQNSVVVVTILYSSTDPVGVGTSDPGPALSSILRAARAHHQSKRIYILGLH